MNRSLRRWLFVGVAVAAMLWVQQGAAQAQTAKQGPLKGQFGWFAVGKIAQIGENHLYWTGEFTGAFFNDDASGIFHRSSVKCPAVNDVHDGKSHASGYCIITDMAGDTATVSWVCSGDWPTCPGSFKFIGGTGKYAGISGDGPFKGVFVTQTEGYAVWNSHYKLP